jgi:hypothetical protein
MAHVFESAAFDLPMSGRWLNAARLSFDVVAALTDGLGAAWEVVRNEDPFGEVAIVVFPADDAAGLPSFMLYENNGLVEVATVHDDVWSGSQVYANCPQAAAAIVTASAATLPQPAYRV